MPLYPRSLSARRDRGDSRCSAATALAFTRPISLASEAAFGSDKALNGASQHKQVGLFIRSEIWDDFLSRNFNPAVVQPSVPNILWISIASGFDFELCFH